MSHPSQKRRNRDRNLNCHTQIAEIEQHLRVLRKAHGRILAGHVIEGSTQRDIEESIVEGDATLGYLRGQL